jgi:hypothetical protein
MEKKSIFDGLRKQARKDRERGMMSSADAVEFYKTTGKFAEKKSISKAIDSWEALKERWQKLGKENRSRRGKTMTEETLEKMRVSQRMRRKKELHERMRNAKCLVSSGD